MDRPGHWGRREEEGGEGRWTRRQGGGRNERSGTLWAWEAGFGQRLGSEMEQFTLLEKFGLSLGNHGLRMVLSGESPRLPYDAVYDLR